MTEPESSMDSRECAIAILYRQHAARLRGTAARMLGSVLEAEDVVQEAFLRLQRAEDLIEGVEGAWLRTTVIRLSLMRMRSQRRRRKRTRILEWNYASNTTNPADRIDALMLDRAIAALPDSLRPVFVMHHVEGLTHSEIGVLLGISTAASAKRLSRAVQRLRSQLEES